MNGDFNQILNPRQQRRFDPFGDRVAILDRLMGVDHNMHFG